MRDLRVDTDQIVSCVDNIQSASDFMGAGAKDRLESICDRVVSAALGHDGDATGSVDDFRSNWQGEFGTIADMLSGFKDALTTCASAFDATDQDIANACRPQTTSSAV